MNTTQRNATRIAKQIERRARDMGHQMFWSVIFGHGGEKTLKGKCLCCGGTAIGSVDDDDNELEIAGSALAMECTETFD
jgi:hypothetical protein